MSFDAVVLAGGSARRLDGADKALLEVGGVRLLDRVLAAVTGANRVVVVGPARDGVGASVTWCVESPPGGGPVAALATALPLTTAGVIITLAVDLPFIASAVPLLLDALPGFDVAVLVDPSGRRNLLAAAWRRDALRDRLAAVRPSGAAVRQLFDGAEVREVPDPAGYGRDCDTWAELTAARAEGGS